MQIERKYLIKGINTNLLGFQFSFTKYEVHDSFFNLLSFRQHCMLQMVKAHLVTRTRPNQNKIVYNLPPHDPQMKKKIKKNL